MEKEKSNVLNLLLILVAIITILGTSINRDIDNLKKEIDYNLLELKDNYRSILVSRFISSFYIDVMESLNELKFKQQQELDAQLLVGSEIYTKILQNQLPLLNTYCNLGNNYACILLKETDNYLEDLNRLIITFSNKTLRKEIEINKTILEMNLTIDSLFKPQSEMMNSTLHEISEDIETYSQIVYLNIFPEIFIIFSYGIIFLFIKLYNEEQENKKITQKIKLTSIFVLVLNIFLFLTLFLIKDIYPKILSKFDITLSIIFMVYLFAIIFYYGFLKIKLDNNI